MTSTQTQQQRGLRSAVCGSRALLSGLAALSLSGCISIGGEAPEMLLTLTPQSTLAAGPGPSGQAASALLIEEPDAEQRIAVTRVPVQVDGSSVAYLTGAEWVERPARLFRRLLAETVRARSGRLVMERDDSSVVPGETLRGTLRQFGYDAAGRSVTVTFDAVRRTRDGTLQTRRFTATEQNVEPEGIVAGAALNRAANRVAQEVADWIG